MKTVEDHMNKLIASCGPVGVHQRVYDKIAQHLTQQAAEWQIALNEASYISSQKDEQIDAQGRAIAKHQQEMDTTAVELKGLHELADRLRSDNSSISVERRQLKNEVHRLVNELDDTRRMKELLVAEKSQLAATLDQFRESGFLAASCKDCGANLRPEDIMGAIKHKPGCPNDVFRQAVNAVTEQWRRQCERKSGAPKVQETLDRALGRLDEVEAKLKLVIGMVLDEDRRRL